MSDAIAPAARTQPDRADRQGGRRARSARACPVADLDERDPDYIRETLPAQWLLASLWFRGEVRGLGNIPEDGPVLLVGNHSGGNMSPDSLVFTLAFSTYFGVERRFYQLAHNLVLSMPGLGFLRKYGTVAASPENAERALASGAAVLVYPGGDHEVHRPIVGGQHDQLRRPSRLRAPRARARRPDRPGRLDRRAGDGAVPQPRRGPLEAAHARPPVSPEGAADLDRRAVGTERRRHVRPHPAAGEDHRSRCCRRSTCASSSAPAPDVDEIYDHVTTTMQETLDALAAERRLPIIG